MDIKDKVESLRKFSASSCPFKIADDLGYSVNFHELPESIKGYHTKSSKIKSIVVNKNLSEGKQEFVCAHELGHAILHPDVNLPFFNDHTFFSTDKIELEANIFAATLLFSHRESISISELEHEYEIEPDILKDILGERLGQKSFCEY